MSTAFRVGDKVYVADKAEITGVEARAFRRAVGVAPDAALQKVARGELDSLEWVAGWKWIFDSREDDSLTFDAVLESVTGDSWEWTEEEEPDPTPGADSAPSSPPSPVSTDSNPGTSTDSISERSMSTSAS